jgi:DNA-binding transcriptional MocR family regulator
MTIQQAMRQLIVEGLIYTRKGQGTFVRKNFLQLSQWELPGSDYFGATKTWEHLRGSDQPGDSLRAAFSDGKRAKLVAD